VITYERALRLSQDRTSTEPHCNQAPKSSQVNTPPKAKSQAKDKRAKDRQKYAALRCKVGVTPPGFEVRRRMSRVAFRVFAAEQVNTGRFFENTQNAVRMLAHAKHIGNTSKYAQIYRSRFYASRHGSQPSSARYVRAARSEVCHANPDPTKLQHLIGTHPLDTTFLLFAVLLTDLP
jgi:ribosomal protein S14